MIARNVVRSVVRSVVEQSTGSLSMLRPLADANGNLAILDFAPSLSLFYANGMRFPSASTLWAALGASVAGNAVAVGGYVGPSPVNLLTNGTFDSDTTGWTPNGSGASFSSVAGEGVFDIGASQSSCWQGLSGYPGRGMQFQGTLRRGSNTANSPFLAMSLQNTSMSGNVKAGTPAIASNVQSRMYSSTWNNALYYGIKSSSNVGTVIVDNFTLVESMPFPGWVDFATSSSDAGQAIAIVIEATSPAAYPVSGEKVLWQSDVNSEIDRIRLSINTTGNLILSGRVNAANQFTSFDFGVLPTSTRFKFALTGSKGVNADNSTGFAASLNGETAKAAFASNLNFPAATHMRIGRDVAGASLWDGDIHRVTMLKGRQPQDWVEYMAASSSAISNAFRAEGDSYMAYTSGDELALRLQNSTGKLKINTAVGGSNVASQRDRILNKSYLARLPVVCWNGSADNNYNIQQNMDAYAAMYTATAGRILFMIPVDVGPSVTGVKSANAIALETIRDNLIALYGASKVYDAMPAIHATFTSPTSQDLLDMSAGVVPASGLIDTVHMNNTLKAAIATDPVLVAKIQAL